MKPTRIFNPRSQTTITKIINEIISMESTDTQQDIALRCGFSNRTTLSKYIKKYINVEGFLSLKESLRKPSTPPSPLEDWIPVSRKHLDSDYLVRNVDPIVSTEERSFSDIRFAPKKEGSNWSEEIEVIEDRYIQPIKRIRIGAHTFTNAGLWRNGEKLLKVTAEIAKSDNELYLTQEDAIIVSRKLARKESLIIGDKLLSLNGLKCIIALIRDQKPDLIVNEKNIFGEGESHKNYGAVKQFPEMEIYYSKGGRRFISYIERAKREISGQTTEQIDDLQSSYDEEWESGKKNRIYKPNQAKISPTLLPFILDIFESYPNIFDRNAQDFQGVLKMVNAEFEMTIDGLTFKPLTTPPTGEGVIEWKGSWWSSTRKYDNNAIYTKDKEDIGKSGVPIIIYRVYYPFKPGCIYLPQIFYDRSYYQDRFGNDIASHYNRNILNPTGKQSEAFSWFLHKALFGKIQNSLTGLTAIPINVTNKREIHMNPEDITHLELRKDNAALVYREPVVNDKSIQLVTIVIDNDLPSGRIGISLEAQTEMFGDFDGDTLSIIGTKEIKEFPGRLYYELKGIKIQQPKGLPERIPLPRSEKEQIELAKKEHLKRIQTSRDIGKIGDLTKVAFIVLQNRNELINIKKAAESIEKMKDRKDTKMKKSYDAAIIALRKVCGRSSDGKYWLTAKERDLKRRPAYFVKLCTSRLSTGNLEIQFPLQKLLTKATHKKPEILASTESPFAKWIMLLQNMEVELIKPRPVKISTKKELRALRKVQK